VIFGLSLGFFVGLFTGFLGLGGGLFFVPLLTYNDYPYATAVGTSSFMVAILSLSSTLRGLWQKDIHFKHLLYLGPSAILASFAGASLIPYVPTQIAYLLCSFTLISIGVFKFSRMKKKNSLPNLQTKPSMWLWNLTGASGGILSGLFGIGGGVLLVPFQSMFLNISFKKSVLNSLGVIFLSSVTATTKFMQSGHVDYTTGFYGGLGGIVGVFLSQKTGTKLSQKHLDASFLTLLLCLSLYFFTKALFT
jgi:uncharacterized membrane protein YfcA